jgi:hypothetical protein
MALCSKPTSKRAALALAGLGMGLCAALGSSRAQTVDFRIVEVLGRTQVQASSPTLDLAVQARVTGGGAGGSNVCLAGFSFDIVILNEPDANGTLAKDRIQNADYTYYTGAPTTGAGGFNGMAEQYTFFTQFLPGFGGSINTDLGSFTNTPGSQEIGLVTAVATGTPMLLTPGMDPLGDGNPATFSPYGQGATPPNGTVVGLPVGVGPTYFAQGQYIDIYRFRYTTTNFATRTLTIRLQNVEAQTFTQLSYGSGSWSALSTDVPSANIFPLALFMPVSPTGSCCAITGACSLASQSSCLPGSLWTLGGTCTPNTCALPGACCAVSGGCTSVFPSSCTGLWTSGVACSPNPCPQPGACCARGGACAAQFQTSCASAGGIFLGVNTTCTASSPCPQVVISQIYTSGGDTGAIYNADFIELFNRGSTAQSLAGWSIQYTVGVGTSWVASALPTFTLQPGQYYLIKGGAGSVGAALPTPNTTNSLSMSATAGKIALCNTTAALNGAIATGTGPTILDFVGYGSANGYSGPAPAPAPGPATSLIRAAAGCTDTASNTADFVLGGVNPRNSSTTISTCSSGCAGPTITALVGAGTACTGSTVPLTIAATGTSLTYQWRKNRIAIAPATNPTANTATLLLTNLQAADAATYDCIVSTPCGTAISVPASLSISCVPYASAGPTDNATFAGTRPDPGPNGAAMTLSYNSLTLQPGSTFNLGVNELLILGGGTGTLTINTGATFNDFGTAVLGNVYSSGLFATTLSHASLVTSIQGGVVQIQSPPVINPNQSPLNIPSPFSSPFRIAAHTLVSIGNAGFGATNGGIPGAGLPNAYFPGHYQLSSPSLIVNGTLAWDGQIDPFGSFSESSTGTLRIFIAGATKGQSFNALNIIGAATLSGSLQIVLQPEVLGYLPHVGDTFDLITAGGGLTLPQGSIPIQTLMTANGASFLGITLPAFSTGFTPDPSQLVSLPQNLFAASVVNGNTLRITMTSAPPCGLVSGPHSTTTCPTGGGATFTAMLPATPVATYQWQYRGPTIAGVQRAPTGWANLAEGANSFGAGASATTVTATGVNADTLSIAHNPANWPTQGPGAGGSVRCIITSDCGQATSPSADISICRTDFDCSGDLTVLDIFAFLNAWFAGDPRTDFDNTPGVQLTDVLAFLAAWFNGC